MKLHVEIRQLLEKMAPNIPPEVGEVMAAATKKLAESGLADKALQPGEKIPVFELPNAAGQLISSASMLSNGPLILSFYRGAW